MSDLELELGDNDEPYSDQLRSCRKVVIGRRMNMDRCRIKTLAHKLLKYKWLANEAEYARRQILAQVTFELDAECKPSARSMQSKTWTVNIQLNSMSGWTIPERDRA